MSYHRGSSGGVFADGVEGVGLTLLAKTSEKDHLSFSLEPRLCATSQAKTLTSLCIAQSGQFLCFLLDTLT